MSTSKNRNTGLWISVLYLAEGFPYTVVNLMSVVFLKDIGATNELIGLTSFLYLPWVLKGFWGIILNKANLDFKNRNNMCSSLLPTCI